TLTLSIAATSVTDNSWGRRMASCTASRTALLISRETIVENSGRCTSRAYVCGALSLTRPDSSGKNFDIMIKSMAQHAVDAPVEPPSYDEPSASTEHRALLMMV